jgi:hypothetical protein
MWLWRFVVLNYLKSAQSNYPRQTPFPTTGDNQSSSLQMRLLQTPSSGSVSMRSRRKQNQRGSGGRSGGTPSRKNF